MNNTPDNENQHPPKRILVAPLNWGLGHVTRCIPIIYALKKRGCEVFLASDGAAFELLKAEFPGLPCFKLPAYEVRYGSENMILNIARRLPAMVVAVRREQWATEKLVSELRLDGVLSDNRYGCFSRQVPSVILTHQLNLRVPFAPLEWAANWFLKKSLAKFDSVWIPDEAGATNLSGELSHGKKRHDDTHFIGILTRMKRPAEPLEFDFEVAVVLSGPEPQRTFLENKLMEQALALPQRFLFVLGKTSSKKHFFAAENVEVVSFLTSKDLNDVFTKSQFIVCRSGYSSLMDLAALGKKAILIPTPGQTEQEYLAKILSERGLFLTQPQKAIDLKIGLEKLTDFSGFEAGQFSTDRFETTLDQWLAALPEKNS